MRRQWRNQIPQQMIGAEMLKRLHRTEMQEAIRFSCLDSLQWAPKIIVGDKAYFTETELLAKIHLEQLKELNRPFDV